MDLNRIERLEDQVGNVREDQARNSEAIEHLTDSVEHLTTSVAELTAALNKGRGALWAMIGGASAVSSLLTLGGIKLFGGN